MAMNVTAAKIALAKAKEDLQKHDRSGVPSWYLTMFRVEVECCEDELRALT
jgi:hypothetical protein